MNTTYDLIPAHHQTPHEDDHINFARVFDALINARWQILTVTLIAVLIGAAYSLLAQPTYRADTMVHIEQGQTEGANNLMGELATAFNVKSTASAEMEIVRSRHVIGEAADNLQLYVSAQPRYLPIVGQWLAKHAEGLSDNSRLETIYGLSGYVWGKESIQVAKLDVPVALESKPLTLRATEGGYTLHGPDGRQIASGQVGEPAEIAAGAGDGQVLIKSLQANPGAEFVLTRSSRLAMIEDLQRRIMVSERSKPSGVMALSLEDSNPKRAANILNAVGAAYVKQNVDRKSAEAEKSLGFLQEFLPQLKTQLDEADKHYTAFRDEHGTFDLGTEGTLSLNASVNMQTRLFELQQKRRELAAQFGPSHPSIQALDAQIAALTGEVARLTTRIKTLPDLEQRLLTLKRDVKINGELYAGLLSSTQQLRLIKEGKVGNVRVVDAAVAPEYPVKPNRALVMSIAGLAGLLLGTGIALIRNMLRTGVKAPNDIESTLGLNVYATVPRVQARPAHTLSLGHRTHAKHVLAQAAPNDPAVESLRSLRTSLGFALQGALNNIVMLTGPTPNIGKTFTSVNLAAVLGAADKRVLLVDADFRSGHVHQYFSVPRDNGFSELIRGELTLHQAVRPNVLPNVDVLTTGALPRNPAELLLSPVTIKLLQDIAVGYDVVLVDTAPVLAVSDALALAPYMGTVFMLARAQQSTIGELEEATKRLNQAGAHVKGVIFNDFDPAHHRFSSRYGGYQHGYYGYGVTKH